VKKNNLLHSTPQIYNVDETGIPRDPKAPNVVAKKGMKKVRHRSTGRKGQITVMPCASPAGKILPSTILFDAKKV